MATTISAREVGLVSRPPTALVGPHTHQFTPIATPPTSLKSHPSSLLFWKLHCWFLFTTPAASSLSPFPANRNDVVSNGDEPKGRFDHVLPALCVSPRHFQCHLGRPAALTSGKWWSLTPLYQTLKTLHVQKNPAQSGLPKKVPLFTSLMTLRVFQDKFTRDGCGWFCGLQSNECKTKLGMQECRRSEEIHKVWRQMERSTVNVQTHNEVR